MTHLAHQNFLLSALSEAKLRRGFCAPNPSVGAVLVKDNQIVARGHHFASGHPHAEVAVLRQIDRDSARDATLYVTLEPCCHWGKTPPCTELIKKYPLKAVYYGFRDPNPLVSGFGETSLNQAGIYCQQVSCEAIHAFYQSYQYWRQTGKPYTTIKMAISLDSKYCGVNGTPLKITGDAMFQFTHQCRRQSDAILTSVNTIVNDDPQMNVRLDGEQLKKSIYIVDSQLRLPDSAKIFNTSAIMTVFHHQKANALRRDRLISKGVRCIPVNQDSKGKGLDISQILAIIGQHGIHDLWIEVGKALWASFIHQQLVNRAYLCVAPKIFGDSARSLFDNLKNDLPKPFAQSWQVKGNDIVCEMRFNVPNLGVDS